VSFCVRLEGTTLKPSSIFDCHHEEGKKSKSIDIAICSHIGSKFDVWLSTSREREHVTQYGLKVCHRWSSQVA
jgi:hypothetical protein